MKNLTFKTGALILATMFMAGPAHATLITLGEGNTGEGTPLYGNIDGVPLSMPTGGSNNGLTYTLTGIYASATAGDIRIYDPWESNQVGDIIRFDGAGHVTFYSLGDEGSTTGADVSPAVFASILATTSPTSVLLPEQGNEAYNWANYTPLVGQAGYVAADPTLTYKYVSDTPEPATIMLLGIGALGMLGMKHGKRREAEVA